MLWSAQFALSRQGQELPLMRRTEVGQSCGMPWDVSELVQDVPTGSRGANDDGRNLGSNPSARRV